MAQIEAGPIRTPGRCPTHCTVSPPVCFYFSSVFYPTAKAQGRTVAGSGAEDAQNPFTLVKRRSEQRSPGVTSPWSELSWEAVRVARVEVAPLCCATTRVPGNTETRGDLRLLPALALSLNPPPPNQAFPVSSEPASVSMSGMSLAQTLLSPENTFVTSGGKSRPAPPALGNLPYLVMPSPQRKEWGQQRAAKGEERRGLANSEN